MTLGEAITYWAEVTVSLLAVFGVIRGWEWMRGTFF